MKILHFADVHLDSSTRENVEHAMAEILGLARAEKPDLIVNAGDVAMKRGYLTPWVAEALRAWHVELAKVAPVVVVAGNHDLSHSWDEAGTLRGALAISEAGSRIHLADRPDVVTICTDAGDIAVACLPYPSKYSLLTQQSGLPAHEVNERLSELLQVAVRGLGAEAAETGLPAVLVYHGSIAGAKTGTELAMTTEIDIVLPESAIPSIFQAVLCGHIHKPQTIGRAIYPGSPCPLNFGEDHEHGVVIWEGPASDQVSTSGTRDDLALSHLFLALMPKHRLLTLDWREDPPGSLTEAHRRLDEIDLKGVKVRVLMSFARGVDASNTVEWTAAALRERGAADVRVQVERGSEVRDPSIGGTVQAEASLDSLLDAYGARNPDLNGTLEAMKELGAAIDGELPPEVRMLERLADYRLRVLRWSNWKSFGEAPGEVRLAELGALVVVEGENASGKSNLMEVESFALWGKLPRGKQPLGELVRQGASEAWVEAEFEAGGMGWSVRRTIRVSTRGIGAGDLVLKRCAKITGYADRPDLDVEWAPANRGNARETQEAIEQLVGPFELYLATRFASQGDIDRLIDMTGAELKDTIQAALGTGIFEHREAAARLRATKLEFEVDKLLTQASVLDDQANADYWRDTVAEHQSAHVATDEKRAFARRELQEASDALEAAKLELTTGQERAAKHAEKQLALAEHDRRIEKMRMDRIDLESAIASGPTAEAMLESHEANRKALHGHEDGERQHKELRRTAADAERRLGDARRGRDLELERRDREISGAKAEHGRLVGTVQAREAELDRDVRKTIEDQAESREILQGQIDRSRETAQRIGTAPFGEKCAAAKCGLLSIPIAARDELPALERNLVVVRTRHQDELREKRAAGTAALAALQEQLTQIDARIQALASERTLMALELERQIELLQGDLEQAQRAVADSTFDPAYMTALREAVAGFDVATHQRTVRAAAEATGKRDALLEEWGRVASDREAVAKQLADLPTDDVLALAVAVKKAGAAKDEAVTLLSSWEAQLAKAAEKLAGARALLEAAEKAEAALTEKRAEIECLQKRLQVAQVFARAMGRDGVPFLLLERAIPAIEEHANRFLGTDDLKLEIEPMRDLRSGETRSEVYVRYRDRFGLHGLPAASGYQRVALGYALRAALAQVQAEAHGLKVSHWIADEGWGAFDENRVLDGQQMLLRLKDAFDRVFFVSHVGPIREVAESRLRVLPDPQSGSRLERVA